MATNAVQSSIIQPSKADAVRINAAVKSINSISKAAVVALADPFNADHVVENPSVEIERPLSGGELVDATVSAHKVHGKWITSIVWNLTTNINSRPNDKKKIIVGLKALNAQKKKALAAKPHSIQDQDVPY